LKRVAISPDEEPIVAQIMKVFQMRQKESADTMRREAAEELKSVQRSIQALLQKFLDNVISKELFDEGHTSLLMQRQSCEEKLGQLNTDPDLYKRTLDFLSALRSACQTFCTGTPEEMRLVIVETNHGGVIERLLERECCVFPVHARSAKCPAVTKPTK
jgi:hypothetical protein